MITEFSVSNFRSFKSLQTLSLLAQPLRSKNNWLDDNTFAIGKGLSLLKTKAIFGANASGKSNLITAIGTFITIVRDSVKDEGVLSRIQPFLLNEESENQPTFFQIVFVLDNVKYRYGFEADKKEVKSEWLYGKPEQREVPYFIREGQSLIKRSDSQFPEAKQFSFLLNEDNEIVRSNALFLTAAAALNGKLSKKILTAFSNIILLSGLDDVFMRQVVHKKLAKETHKNKVVKFLNEAGIDIEDLSIEEVEFDPTTSQVSEQLENYFQKVKKFKLLASLKTRRGSDDQPIGKLSWSFHNHESDGTKKMLDLSSFILDSIEHGRTLILDEFEARLHTSLSQNIVQLFNASHSNPNNAQFIFSTHDTNLLSNKLMRRDQIAFAKKDEYGQSTLYSLADIKGVRNDESYEKNYLIGKYDAIPKIGNLDLLQFN